MFKYYLYTSGALVKRLLYFFPELAISFSLLPLLLFINKLKVKAKPFIYIVLLITLTSVYAVYSLFNNFPINYRYFFVPLSLVLFIVQSNKNTLINRNALFTVVLFNFLYAFHQKYVGYFPWDISFIQSNYSAVDAKGYLDFVQRRANGMMAGVPEATLFFLCTMHFAWLRRRIFLLVISGLGVYFAGSRAVILSFFIAGVFTMTFGNQIRFRQTFLFLIVAISFYLFLAFILPLTAFLEVKSDDNRFLVYGTFGYRVLILSEVITNFEIHNIILPIQGDFYFYDNFYVTTVVNFGLLGGAVYLMIFFKCLILFFSPRSTIYFLTVVSVLLYTDQALSMYFMITLFLAIKLHQSDNVTHTEGGIRS